MKILILGASGFIGRPIAQALLRRGHTVIGQTRSKATARKLEAEEITPLVADPADSASWRSVVKEVDVVIDCVGGNDISKLCASIFDAVLEEAKVSRPNGPPLSYIYCSGTWVHGNHLEEPYGSTSDRAPVDDPMPITAWRLIHEQRALAAGEEFSKHLTVNVVRPSLLYGKSASITGLIFATAREGEVKFAGTGRERIATIHCDDLGELFARVAEKSYMVKGVIFEGSNPYPESVSYILDQLCIASGAKGLTYIAIQDPFSAAIASSILLRPTLGQSLVGWEPRKPPLAEGMKQYYHSYLASLPNLQSSL